MIAVLSAEESASGISGGASIGSSPEMSTTSSGRDGSGNDGVGAARAVDTSTVEAVRRPTTIRGQQQGLKRQKSKQQGPKLQELERQVVSER
ncbi:hypothetical protein PsorP6_007602 [Peronosclerospora sorghi]|uniref:Uncharacterized protein n=1 Tax=Peronosclerospora sorghi TaxID=230839 RepID=A0ACC0W769_9STRA|nr:hypothetical protein PsorP6_007602 [Peronosclerospora sorghi]